jgi:acyl-CoA synthetase (AMP-forming)/AMP-acid ligase II
MIIMILQQPDIASYDLSHFRLLFYGSSPIDAVWVRRALDAFPGADLQHNYGLTETSPILTAMELTACREALANGQDMLMRSAGRAVAGVDLTIRDDDGNELPTGAVGEVVVRGPNVTSGYFNRPEETAAAFKNGWFHTGDMGRLDENGLLFLVDRKKDMVITGGENVYTTEVEAAIYLHPNVQEAAVIGVPDEKYGEALFAVIVPKDGKTITVEELVEHCRGRIGAYKIPRRIDVVAELPKSPMGKILKTELRRIYAGRETKF